MIGSPDILSTKAEQLTTSQNKQVPPASQTEQLTTQLSDEEPSQPKDESAESQKPKQQYVDQLPPYLKNRFSIELTHLMRVVREQETQGLKEVGTLVLLERVAGEGTLPPDPENPKEKVLTIELTTNPPEIEINGSTKKIVEITEVKGDSFVCKLADQEGTVNIPVSQVIEAQKAIVDKAEGTGIVKASALKKFVETAREQLKPSKEQEEQPLSEDKQQTLDRLNELIGKLEGQLTPDQATFVETLSLVLPSQQPAIQEKIQTIEELLKNPSLDQEKKQELEKQKAAFQQILDISQKQTEELINEWVQKVYSEEFSTKKIDKINNLLETGNINPIKNFLEKENISNEIKNKVGSIVESIKDNFPTIGGIAGILVLLMIFQSSKQER